jgi:hypothetical protein
MTIINNPRLVENDAVEPMFPKGSGARQMMIIADQGVACPTKNVIKTYNDYPSALVDIGPASDTNILLQAIYDAFDEGAVYDPTTDNLGVETVYVINVRQNDTLVNGELPPLASGDWTDAIALAETKSDKDMIEVYPGCFDVSIMGAAKTHALALRTSGLKRNEFFTIDPSLDLIDDKVTIFLMTDSTKISFINDTTISIHTNPKNLVKYATKCACTPYGTDPGYGPYRTITMDGIIELGTQDADDYTGAGFVVDAESLNPAFVGKPEPVMAVNTGYRINEGGTIPTDAFMHHKFNVDHQSITTNDIVMSMIKKNNTVSGRAMALASCTGALNNEVTAGNLQAKTTTTDGRPVDPGYFIELVIGTLNPFEIIKNQKVRPQGSVHMVTDNEIIQAPVAGGV